uniref:Uncharacterized protein n=1 Tax=Helianthus annuus TaxID=4232 RepID=A0A251SXE4_HELAN
MMAVVEPPSCSRWYHDSSKFCLNRAKQRSLGILDLGDLLSGVAGVVMGRQEGFM